MSTVEHGLPLEFTTVGPTTHTTPRHGASRWIRTCLAGLFAVVLAFFVLEEAVAQVADSRVTVEVCAYDDGPQKDDIAFLYWEPPTGTRQVLFPSGTPCVIDASCWDLTGAMQCTTVQVEEGFHTLRVEAPSSDEAERAGATNVNTEGNTAAFQVRVGQMQPQRRRWILGYRAQPPLDFREWRLYVARDTVRIDPLDLSVDRATMAEANGTARVSVSTGGVTFEYDREITLTFTGTATEGEDYTASAETLTLRAGESTVGATLTAVDDGVAEGNETISVTASMAEGEVIGNPVVTIIDDDMAEFRVSVDRATMAEANGTARVSVSTGGVTFEYDREITLTFTGTATEGEDYTASAETLTLRAGESTVGATLTAVDDGVAEGNETISVTASMAEGEVIGNPVVTIIDDDMAEFRVSVDRATMAEANGTARVSVSTGGVTFEYDREITLTFTGTATEGEDYTASAETLTLRAGESTVGATLTAVDDGVAEGNETISVTASMAEGEVIGNPVVTIIDDDMAEFRVSVDRATMAEANGTARVSVSTGGVTFEYDREITLTFTGTATEGEDYTASAETLTLRAGESTVGATLTAVDDSVAEGNETINVTASTVEEGAIGEEQVITLSDDDVRGVTVSERTLMVKEGDQQGRSFSVKLNSQPTAPVSVTPVVPTGTDVEVAPETLTFMPIEWNTAKTVVVTAKDDSDADNDAPVTLTFVVAGGGYDAVAVDNLEVMIEEDDQVTVEEKRVVQEAVKTVTASAVANVTTNIGARFSAARGGGTVLTMAGQPVFVPKSGLGLAVLDEHRGLHWNGEDGFGGAGRSLSAVELLRSSAFQVSLGATDEGKQPGGLSQWTLWGRGDMLFFDRDSVGERYDGRLLAGYLGVDGWLNERWLIGVAASRTGVKADYGLEGRSGKLDLTTTGVHPYVRYAPDERSELWVILGAGTGRIGNRREGVSARESSDVKMYMGAAGGRLALAPGAVGGVDVAFLSDVGFGVLESDSGTGLETIDNLAVETWRARLGVEGSYTLALEEGKALTPFVEVSGRYDGGGGDGDTGVEVAGGLSYADPKSGFGVEARANVLAFYSQSDYREHGASITASLTPQPGGEGLSLAVTPQVGRRVKGADVLWRDDPFAVNGSTDAAEMSLDARVGYGVSVPALKGMLTPFGEVRLWDGDGRRMRAGVRFGRTGLVDDGFSMEIFGDQNSTGGDAEHRIGLVGRWRF